VVKSLSLFTTEIDTLDNVRITAPNGKVFGEIITNFTAHGQRRIDIVFSVDLEDDLQEAMAVLCRIANEHPKVHETPRPSVEVTGVVDGRATTVLHVWCAGYDYGPLRTDLYVQARTALADAGIKPAYPRQMGVSREGLS
jgi:small conductance mechanosensitive channel